MKSLIINCGASHITYANFDSTSGSLVCDDLHIEQLNYDLSDEEAWHSAIADRLRFILGSAKKGDATIIAPGYQLLSKGIKVPHVEASRQSQIIAFEAQQNIPYPLNEVVWGHEVVADDGVETDVMLVAFKSLAANKLCNTVSQLGIKPVGVQASSILDLNAYRYIYQGVSDTVLLVNIGARSSNLLFISESACLVRNISLGGNTLTQQLSDRMGQPFVAAEQAKIDYFSGAVEYAEGDPTYDAIYASTEGFMRRMNQEITRSIINYKRQNKGQAPVSILLTGRGSLIPGLSEQLMGAQNIAVDYFDPTQGITAGAGVDPNLLANNYFQISEVLGLACRPLLPESLGIDLLPPTVARKQAFAKKKIFLFMAAACLPLAPVPAMLHYSSVSSEYEDTYKSLKKDINVFSNLDSEIQDNISDSKIIIDKISDIDALARSKSNWVEFFADLQNRLVGVKDVWLENLRVSRGMSDAEKKKNRGRNRLRSKTKKASSEESDGYVLRMSGKMLLRAENSDSTGLDPNKALQRVTDFMNELEESEFVDSVYDPKWDTKNPYVLGFGFKLKINQDKPL